MRVAVHGHTPHAGGKLAALVDLCGFDAYPFDRAADFCSALFRDPEMVGAHIAFDHLAAVDTVLEWRQADMRAGLLVLVEHRGAATDLFRVMMAGADAAQWADLGAEGLTAHLCALRDGRGRADPARMATPRVIDMPNGAVFLPDRGKVRWAGGEVHLSVTESALLAFLAGAKGEFRATAEIYLHLTADSPEKPSLEVVRVFVRHIRRKLEPALGGLDAIECSYGRGYRFAAEGVAPALGEARVRVSR